MGTPPGSFAADAHDRIMVRVPSGSPDTRLWRECVAPVGKLHLGHVKPPRGYPDERGIERLWLDSWIPIQGGSRIDPHGYDAGKKIKGKKRHLLVDTQGLGLHAIVHAANLQDRDGGALLVADAVRTVPIPAQILR